MHLCNLPRAWELHTGFLWRSRKTNWRVLTRYTCPFRWYVLASAWRETGCACHFIITSLLCFAAFFSSGIPCDFADKKGTHSQCCDTRCYNTSWPTFWSVTSHPSNCAKEQRQTLFLSRRLILRPGPLSFSPEPHVCFSPSHRCCNNTVVNAPLCSYSSIYTTFLLKIPVPSLIIRSETMTLLNCHRAGQKA